MSMYPYPKPTQREMDNRQFLGLLGRKRNDKVDISKGVDLIESLTETLLSRTPKERAKKGGKKVVATDEDGVHEIRKLAENIKDLNVVERRFGVKISVNGNVTVATCCRETSCPHTSCTHRC